MIWYERIMQDLNMCEGSCLDVGTESQLIIDRKERKMSPHTICNCNSCTNRLCNAMITSKYTNHSLIKMYFHNRSSDTALMPISGIAKARESKR